MHWRGWCIVGLGGGAGWTRRRDFGSVGFPKMMGVKDRTILWSGRADGRAGKEIFRHLWVYSVWTGGSTRVESEDRDGDGDEL